MNAKILGTGFALALMSCLACATVRVSTDHDPSADFTSMRSYAWLDDRSGVDEDREGVSSLLDRRIRSAIESELGEKGLTRADRADAAILVAYRLSVETKLDVDTIHTSAGYGVGWYVGMASQTIVSEYEEGTLLIDLIEASSKQLVWRGTGEARLRESPSPEQREERVRQAVREILANFPPSS
jgi:hypothetical protein